MKAFWISVALAFAFPFSTAVAATPAAIQITAAKKSDGSRDGKVIGPVKNRTISEEDVHYQFDLRSMSSEALANVKVKWVVLVTTRKGKLRTGTSGEQAVTLTPGVPVSVKTPSFTLVEAKGPQGAKTEAEIFGWAVRIYSQTGDLLSEEYQPARARKNLEESF